MPGLIFINLYYKSLLNWTKETLMAKALSKRWWKSLSREEQEDYIAKHPRTKFKVSAAKVETNKTEEKILSEGVVTELPPKEETEKQTDISDKDLEELSTGLRDKIDEVLPEPIEIKEKFTEEELDSIEDGLKEYAKTKNKKSLLKPISKMVLKLGMVGISLVVTGSISPTYLFLPSIYQDILSSSDDWSEKGSDMLANSVNFIRKTIKSKNKGKFIRDSVFQTKKVDAEVEDDVDEG